MRKVEIGQRVCWDWSGEARKGRDALMVGPYRVESKRKRLATISGSSLTGLGTWRKEVPVRELVPG